MNGMSIQQGEPVYVRAYSTHRAAVAELIALCERDEHKWGQVRLVTELYDWDESLPAIDPHPRAGAVLEVEAYRLEAIRQ